MNTRGTASGLMVGPVGGVLLAMKLSLLDQSVIFSALAWDPNLRDLVELFVREMPQRIDQLKAAYDSGDNEAVLRLAHRLKGAAGSHGFHQITPFAGALETAVKNNEPNRHIRRALDELVELCERVQPGTP
jgi:HPt (histidine-containing phosphotransfer) domain-containing protein